MFKTNTYTGYKIALFAGITALLGILLIAFAVFKQCLRTTKHLPAQSQQTISPEEQKKNATVIDDILKKPMAPVHGVAATTQDQQTAFFAQYPATLSAVPTQIKNACVHFVGHLHPEVLSIALQAAQNMGITEPIFFYETASVCHAFTSGGFNRLGLNLSYMLAFHPDYRDKLPAAVKEKHIDFFFRHLYHELHHIKYKDDSCSMPAVTMHEAELLGRHCEMRAELGGLWGAHQFHGRDINMKAFYPEDDGAHPTAQDQLRYNKLLSELLSEETTSSSQPDNHTVVETIADAYLAEKSPTLIAKLENHLHLASNSRT